MTASLDHGKNVLAGIVPDRKDLLLYALQHLEPEHFKTEAYKNIFVLLERYYGVTAGILPKHVLGDLMRRSQTIDAAKAILYEEVYADLENTHLEDHEFRYAVDALKDLRAEQMTGEAITVAFEILENGAEVGKEVLRGHREARTYAYSVFADIDKLDNLETAPEGDMRHEADDVWDEYEKQKNGKVGKGVLTGIDSIDRVTGGFQKGELGLISAYAGAGKTQFCCQTAWHAAVMQGVNVFFATSETVRPTVRRRILARHSRLPQFGIPLGLNSTKIKNGALNPKEESILKEVIHDLDTNPAYGRLYIAQVPRGANLSYVEARMNRQGAQWDLGLGIVDYLALLRSDRVRNSEREEFNDILRSAKVFATSFNEGRGVPFLSPWQIRRESYNEALRTGLYGLNSLADTAEAERSSDQIISLLTVPETPKETVLQFLKMRDGEMPTPAVLETDFRCAYLDDKGAGPEAATVSPFGSGSYGF